MPPSRSGQIYWIFTVNHTDQQDTCSCLIFSWISAGTTTRFWQFIYTQSINSISVPPSRSGQIYWIFTVNHTDQQIPVSDWYFHDHHFQTQLLVDWSMIVAILLRDQSNKNYSLQDLNTNWRCKGVTSGCSLIQKNFPQGLFAVITGNSHTTLIPRDLQEYNRSCANNLSIPAALQTS